MAARHMHACTCRQSVRVCPPFANPAVSMSCMQGLACSVVGCANLGLTYRAYAMPIVHLLVAQSLHCITSFNMQVGWAARCWGGFY